MFNLYNIFHNKGNKVIRQSIRYCLSRRQQSGEGATVIHFLCIEQSDQTQLFIILVTLLSVKSILPQNEIKLKFDCVLRLDSTHSVMCTSVSATPVSLVSRDKKLTNTTLSLMGVKMIDSFFFFNQFVDLASCTAETLPGFSGLFQVRLAWMLKGQHPSHLSNLQCL